jgi:hypothetical protein
MFSRKSHKKLPAPRRTLSVEQLEERCLLSADVVLEWNAIALNALKNDSYLGADAKQAGPTRASRALAMVQGAVFDAVNSITSSYTPYLIAVPTSHSASITAAVAQAAHDVLVELFPDYVSTLNADLAADLATVHSPTRRTEGVRVGAAVAANMMAVRSNDNADVTMPYTPGSGPGQWQPDPLHPDQVPVGPLWGDVKMFCMADPEDLHVPPPPALTSQQYTDAFNEVKNYGGDGVTTPTLRTAEQTQIAIFWGYDGSPGLSTPPRLYNQIAEVLAAQQHNTVVQNARFFALVNLAMADAAIMCWDAKFDYNFWRPVTGVRQADTDGNPDTTADANWTPLGAPADNGGGTNFTPPFPSYASGHATFGGALFETMKDFFGRDGIHFTIGSDEFNGVTRDQNGIVRPVVFRSYTSFSQAMEENGQSRIYLGIHWSFDKVQGIAQGQAIADYVFGHFLLPAPGGSHSQAPSHRPSALPADAGREQAHALLAGPVNIITPTPAPPSTPAAGSVSHNVPPANTPAATGGNAWTGTTLLLGTGHHDAAADAVWGQLASELPSLWAARV